MAQRSEIRLEKLRSILDQLKRGETVQNRTLRTWLGEQGYAVFEDEWRTQQALRQELKDKPDAVRGYEARLRVAVLAYNKGEGASTRGKHSVARKHFAKADELFERALEYLQEILTADMGLCVWFDRDAEWTAGSGISLAPGSVPLVVTSRSLDNAGGGLKRQIRSKRDVKISVVEWALLEAVGSKQHEYSDKRPKLDDNKKLAQLEKFLTLRDDCLTSAPMGPNRAIC